MDRSTASELKLSRDLLLHDTSHRGLKCKERRMRCPIPAIHLLQCYNDIAHAYAPSEYSALFNSVRFSYISVLLLLYVSCMFALYPYFLKCKM